MVVHITFRQDIIGFLATSQNPTACDVVCCHSISRVFWCCSEEITLEGIKQYYVDVDKEEWKFDTLLDIYDSVTITQAIIFCNSRKKVSQRCTQASMASFLVSVFRFFINIIIQSVNLNLI